MTKDHCVLYRKTKRSAFALIEVNDQLIWRMRWDVWGNTQDFPYSDFETMDAFIEEAEKLAPWSTPQRIEARKTNFRNIFFRWFLPALGVVGIFDWFIIPFFTGAPFGP